MVAKLNTGRKTNTPIIKRVARKENITDPISCILDQARQHLEALIESYQKKKGEAGDLKERELEEALQNDQLEEKKEDKLT